MAARPIKITIVGDDQASQAFGSAEKSAGHFEGTLEKLGGVSGKAFAAIGAGALGFGAVFAKGLSDAANFEVLNDKLSAQLGLTAQQSESYGKVAGKLYANAYGENMEQVNEAVAAVSRNIGKAATGSAADLERISAKVLDVATAFDQDLGGTAQAVGQLLRTGLAKDADEALDIITVGLQKVPQAGNDLLDTFNEYSVQFQALGIDGKQALGFISAAMQGGARDTDIAADALKEFNLRAKDLTNKEAQEALQTLGFNAAEMARKFAGGGDGAAEAMVQTVTALKGIEDPAKRSQVATQLLGTQAEDLQGALLGIDPTKLVENLGQVDGAAKAVGDTLADNAQTRLTAFKRSLEVNLVNFIGGPVLGTLEGFSKKLGSAFDFSGLATTIKTSLESNVGTPIKDFFVGYKLPDVPLFGSTAQQLGQALAKGIDNGDWSQVGTALADAIGAALSGAADAIGAVDEALKGLVGKVDWGGLAFELGKQAPTLVLGLITGLLNSDFGSLFQFVADHWFEVVFGIVTIAFAPARVIGKVLPLLERIPLVGTLLAWGVRNLNEFGQGIIARVGSLLDEFIGAMAAGFTRVAPGVSGSLTGAFLAVRLAISGFVVDFVRVGGEVIEGLVSGLRSKIVFVGDTIGSIGGTIVNAGRAFTGTLYEIGRDVVEGLIGGLRSKIGDLVGAVGNLGTKAKDAFKSTFKIQSPSKVTRSYGVYLGQGLIEGLDEMSGPASAAMASLISMGGRPSLRTTSLGVGAALAQAGGSAGSRGGSSRPVEVVQHHNWNISGNDPAVTQRQIEKALQKSNSELLRVMSKYAIS